MSALGLAVFIVIMGLGSLIRNSRHKTLDVDSFVREFEKAVNTNIEGKV